ncbi:hypothetical protein LTS72_24580 [Mycobacterium ostraviense]|uniref:Uncharacterized protein n=1 Tax=Mycobacterium ostraviense TaxID=2738409 RepID=A0A162DXG7_9MYCO|nr:hypothetical protein [Mycobacterium ostraviense]KZS59748.1 hypothetical protein A4G28_14260 [Mycobacterium ostraviense]UGT91309.1 hypothetical protein LTS72_24580 [Mycobacterium ostraviense]
MIKVNQQVAAAVGTALLSVILTSQLHQPVMSRRPLSLNDLSHAYSAALVVAVVLVGLTFIPLAFLYKKPEAMAPRHPERSEPGGAAQHSGAVIDRYSLTRSVMGILRNRRLSPGPPTHPRGHGASKLCKV